MKQTLAGTALAVVLAALPVRVHAEDSAHPGENVYRALCATCHNEPEAYRAPSFANMRAMSPSRVEFALTDGKMKAYAEGLSRGEIAALVDYLSAGSGRAGFSVRDAARCADPSIAFEPAFVRSWGIDPSNTRHYGPDRTSVTRANVGRLKLAWAFGLPATSEARSQPVITADTLFVGVNSGHVFALDRETGCVKWHAAIGRPLRTPLTLGEIGCEPVLFFSDAGTHVHAMRARDGEILWRNRVGPFAESVTTAGIVQHGDRLFVPLSSFDVAAATNPAHECCKSHGAVAAIEAATGERIWLEGMTPPAEPTMKSSVGTQLWGPSGAPVWTTPAVDAAAGRLYIGTGENTSAPATDTSDSMIALDMETGRKLWVYQATAFDTFNMACGIRDSGPNCPNPRGPDYDFGGGLTLATLKDGRKVVVGGQKSGVVHVVDAETGDLIWRTRVASGSALGGVHWGVALAGDRIFAPSNDPAWPIPGYLPRPGLNALDLETGEVVWTHTAERGCSAPLPFGRDNVEPWPDCSFYYSFSAAPAATDHLVFAGSLDGMLRAFDGATGEVLWAVETARAFETVNGVAAHGGAIDNAGPQLAGDMVYVQSGYGMFGQMPGNALLAFRVEPAP